MNKEYLSILESIFGDIRDNSDNPDLVSGLISQLKVNINEFFANTKKRTDDWLVSDYTTTTLNRIYNALENPKYNDIKVHASECADALSKYKEYLEGLEEYIKTVFGIQEDDNVGIDAIKEKNSFVFDKNEGYIENLFAATNAVPCDVYSNEYGTLSLNDSVSEFEMVIEYLNNLDGFRDECLSLAELINQEYMKKSNSELFLMKSASAGIYIYSVLSFNQRLVRAIMYNVDAITTAMDMVDRPAPAPREYKMF